MAAQVVKIDLNVEGDGRRKHKNSSVKHNAKKQNKKIKISNHFNFESAIFKTVSQIEVNFDRVL